MCVKAHCEDIAGLDILSCPDCHGNGVSGNITMLYTFSIFHFFILCLLKMWRSNISDEEWQKI